MYAKQYDITDRIISQTNAGVLKWTPSVAGNLETTLAAFTVRLSEGVSSKDQRNPVYIITILDNNGEVVERFDDEDLDNEFDKFRSGAGYFVRLKSLYETCYRRAHGIEEKLDALLKALDEGQS